MAVRTIIATQHRTAVLVMLLAAGILAASPARADDWDDCNAPLNSAERVLMGCTAIISQAKRSTADIAKAYVNRSSIYQRRTNYDQSLSDTEAALKLDPNHVPALLNHGIALRGKGRSDEALADFDRAVEIDPRSVQAYAVRGSFRMGRKEFELALKDLDQAIALRSDFSSSFVARGRVYFETGELDKAVSDFDRAIAIAPTLA